MFRLSSNDRPLLLIDVPLQPLVYLAPFPRYSDILAENCDAPLTGSSWNSGTALELKNYRMTGLYTSQRKTFDDNFIRFYTIHQCDRQTDGHRPTASTALTHGVDEEDFAETTRSAACELIPLSALSAGKG